MHNSGDFMGVTQASLALAVSAQRIRQLVDQGRLRAIRGPNGTRLIDRAAVEEFARNREQRKGGREVNRDR